MIELGIGRRYVRALFELALETQQQEKVLADLRGLRAVLDQMPELEQMLADPRVGVASKRRMLDKATPEGSICDLTRDFLALCTNRGRAEVIGRAADEFADRFHEHVGMVSAKVTAASDLDEGTRSSLQAKLEEVTGKTVVIEYTTDADLIGGMRVQIGSTLYDGSVRRALRDLRSDLMHLALPVGADTESTEDSTGEAPAAE